MTYCEISPLTYEILDQFRDKRIGAKNSEFYGVTDDEDQNIEISIPLTVLDKINRRSSSGSGLEGYFDQKAKEFIQMGFIIESLAYLTQKNVSFKISFFMNDVMNGVDAWLSIGNSRRVSIDVTSICNIPSKENSANKYAIWKAKWQEQGKGRAGILDDTFGRIIIGIPDEVESLSKNIVHQSESIHEAQLLIRRFFWRYREAMDEITFVGMNRKGKNWVNNLNN